MSAHDLLNLLNEFKKSDMIGFIAVFETSLINSIIHKHEC